MTELLGLSTIPFLLAMLAWTPVVVLLHELGHAAVALHATRGEVRVVVGSGGGMRVRLERLELRLWPIPVALPVGICEYEPATLSRPRAEAWIALAGPMASLLWAVLMACLASAASGGVAAMLGMGALGSFGLCVATLLPFRYGRGFGAMRGMDSDGRAAWRILTGGLTPRGLPREPSDRAMHPVLAALLAGIVALALWLDPLLGLALCALVGLAWLLTLAEAR